MAFGWIKQTMNHIYIFFYYITRGGSKDLSIIIIIKLYHLGFNYETDGQIVAFEHLLGGISHRKKCVIYKNNTKVVNQPHSVTITNMKEDS